MLAPRMECGIVVAVSMVVLPQWMNVLFVRFQLNVLPSMSISILGYGMGIRWQKVTCFSCLEDMFLFGET